MTPAPVVRLLFVCTGNICRSAAAERLTRSALAELLPGADDLVQVTSAGTRAVVDAPVHPDSALAVGERGGDVAGFAARQLRAHMIAEADLVLTMTTEHRTAVLGMEPRALQRSFTLREAADLAELVAPAPEVGQAAPGRSLAQRMAAARSRREPGAVDDIDDPVNRPLSAHRDAVDAISACLDRLLPAVVADLRARALLPDAAR
jgi:protein-tyrosine phosphatase